MADIKQTQQIINETPNDVVWIAGKGHPSYPGLIGQTLDIEGKQIQHADLQALSARLTAMETALERIKTRMQQFREYTVEENLIVMWLDKWIEEELPNINQVLEGK